MSAPTLITERLRLRPWREEDLEPFARLNADSDVMAHFPKTLSREESDAMAARIRDGLALNPFGFWAIEAPGIADFIGYTGLSRPSFAAPFMPAIEVGWRLARKFWGHGYASEAADGALRHAFEALALPEIVAFTVPENMRSRAVMERLGMGRDPSEDFEHPALPEGHPLRWHVLYRITSAEWRAQKTRRSEDRRA